MFNVIVSNAPVKVVIDSRGRWALVENLEAKSSQIFSPHAIRLCPHCTGQMLILSRGEHRAYTHPILRKMVLPQNSPKSRGGLFPTASRPKLVYVHDDVRNTPPPKTAGGCWEEWRIRRVYLSSPIP